MNTLVNIFAEQQRVLILQLLNEDSDCCLNEQMLQKGLEMFGHNVSLDKVRTEVAWLEEQGCVTTEDVSYSVYGQRAGCSQPASCHSWDRQACQGDLRWEGKARSIFCRKT